MKKKSIALMLTVSLLIGIVSCVIPVYSFAATSDVGKIIEADKTPLRLYYDEEASHGVAQGYDEVDTYFGSSANLINAHPNDDWERWSIPLGNGIFGVNIFGRTETERVQITDKTLANPYRITSGSTYTDGLNNFSETYIDFGHASSKVTDYSRELDLHTAVSTVSYVYNGVTYTREYFTSYPDNAMVIRLDASEAGALDFVLRPTIPYEQEYMNSPGDHGGKWGTVTSTVENGVGNITLSGTLEYFDIDFVGIYTVVTDGTGTVTATTCVNKDGDTDGTITVNGAKSAYIIINLGTDYELCEETFINNTRTSKPTFSTTLADAMAKVEGYKAKTLSVTEGKGYEAAYSALKANHLADYQELFGRVSLNLNFDERDLTLTTDDLLHEYQNGSGSSYLEALYFQYGRYLLIASSRSGGLPANLQGAWNRYNHAPWASGYWHNVNVQMNYWPAFSTNLAETFEAYVEYNNAYMAEAERGSTGIVNRKNPSVSGQDGGNGWSVATGGYPNDSDASDSIGNLGFTTQLFWEYYMYTGDEQILREVVYPVLVGAARYITKMVKKDANCNYIAIWTDSPEQYVNGSWYYTDKGATYAQSFAYQNNYNMLLAAKELGIDFSDADHEDYEIIQTVLEQIDKYSPIVIGLSGHVKEFFEEDYYGDMGEYTHRHISQLVGLYPGNVINGTTPAWLDAAKIVLTERGDKATGWGVAHRLNLWARVQDGERAYDLLEMLLKVNTATNLWDLHPPFQIDGNLGGTAGVSEMLLQSHAGYIEPLAAIPTAWDSGSFTGLVARGNFTVAAEWENGLATCFNIYSQNGGSVSVKYSGIENAVVRTADGRVVSYTVTGEDLITFDTTEGETYIIAGFTAKVKPASVTGVTTETKFLGETKLSWNASADAAYYRVYVAKESDPTYTLLGTTYATTYTYTPAQLENARLTFAVTAVNAAGVESNRALAYRNPDDTAATVNKVSANVIDGELQVAVDATEYAASYKLYSRKAGSTTWTPVTESSYPIIKVADYDASMKYGISVVSYFGEESEITQITAFNQTFDEAEYSASNILLGKEFVPTDEAAGNVHASGYGYNCLTDGKQINYTNVHDGRFSSKTPATVPATATVSLGGYYLLSELRIFDYQPGDTYGNYLGTGLKVEAYTKDGWVTVCDLASNAEILTHRVKSGAQTQRYISIDMASLVANQIRFTIPGAYNNNSISLWEIECSGIRDPRVKSTEYSSNLLAGQLPISAETNSKITENTYGVYGYDRLTDGILGLHEGRFSIDGKQDNYVTVVYSLHGETALDKLIVKDFSGNPTGRSNETTIELYVDGQWVKYMDAQPLYTDISQTTSDTYSRVITFDLTGYTATKIRLTFKNAYAKSGHTDGITINEIMLSGWGYKFNGESKDNVFDGYVFEAGPDAGAVWNPYTYDKITDGVSNNDNNRFSTSGGTAKVDGILDFGGKLVELHTLTVNYNPYRTDRSGKDITVQVWRDGAWHTVINHVHDVAGVNKETFDLGGVMAEKVRVKCSGSNGDCTQIYEMTCTGFVQTPGSDGGPVEDPSSNILLGTQNAQMTLTGATIHSDTRFNNLELAFDGDRGTRYAVKDAAPYAYSLEIDLGATYPLYTLAFYPFFNVGEASRSDDTSIDLCLDGVWVTVVSGLEIAPSSTPTTVNLGGVKVSKIRINFKNTTAQQNATIYEITCTTGTVTAVDRTALLDAYIALDTLTGDEFGFSAVKDMRLAELKALLADTAADQATIDAYAANVTAAKEKLAAGVPVDTANGDFTQQNVSLRDNVSVNLYGNISEATVTANPDGFVYIEYADGRTEKQMLSDLARADGKLVVSVNMAAAQMTDGVKLRLVLNSDSAGQVIETSVREYADIILAGEFDTATKELMRAMLNYGAYAQKVFNYNVENLANAGVETDVSAITEDKKISVGGSVGGVSIKTWTLTLDSEVTAKFYFGIAENNPDDYIFTLTRPDGTETPLTVEKVGERYRVKVENIYAAHLDDDYVITVRNTATAETLTVTFSATCYVGTVLANPGVFSADIIELVKALKAYATAANNV